MTEISAKVKVYKDLIEHIISEQKEMISIDRLNLFLSKAKRKYKMLEGVRVEEDFTLSLSEDFSEDEEEALKTMSTVIAGTYKVLEMFVGSNTAKDRILDSVDSFRETNPDLDDAGLGKYLPKRDEEEDEEEEEEDEIDEVMEGGVDILKPKEGVPYYDEEKKEWVLKPAHLVKKVKEEQVDDIEPAFEEETIKKPVVEKEEKTRESVETFQWLQAELELGSSYIIEGTGQEKNMLCAEFLKEGLDAGEDVIAILGYPPRLFLAQMQKIGVMEEDLERVHIIDWHTFKEKHVTDIESSGNVHTVPKDPKFMGTVLSRIIGGMDKERPKRTFVSIVSYALAFIDFETVYNFVQISRLKFKKSMVTALFTLEAGQHGKDIRSSFREISDGWIRVREGLSGANTWKMKAEIDSYAMDGKVLRDVVIMRNGIVVLERKDGRGEKIDLESLDVGKELEAAVTEELMEEGEPDIDSYLLDKMEMWKGLGFSVDVLNGPMEEGEEAFKEALADFEKRAGRALELRGRLDEVASRSKGIHDRGLEEDILNLRKKLRDLEDIDGVEKAVGLLEERTRLKMDKESKRREREKEIFRIRMEHWARQGYDTGRLERIMDRDLEAVNKEFADFRAIVNRLNGIRKALGEMDSKGHETEVREIRKRLYDVDGLEETEALFAKLEEGVHVKEKLKETAKTRRNELMNEVFHWALEGYCVDLMDQIDIFREDLSTLENRLGRLRGRITRLREAEIIINGLDLSRHREEEAQVRAMIKDVDKVEEVERRVGNLQEKVQGKLSGDVLALDENIERVRELEETWQKLKTRLLSENRSSRKGSNKGS